MVNKLNTPIKNIKQGGQDIKYPYLENDEGNNTSINNTVNNTDIIYTADYSEIIGHLNQVAKTNYKATTPKTKQLINARLKEGFTVEDFKQVHINKFAEWGGDDKMVKYIRPETLYSNKFEGYLNQKVSYNEKREMIQSHTGKTALQMLRDQGYAQ